MKALEVIEISYTAKRNEYREMLNNFENRFPGTEFSILRFYQKLRKEIMPSEKKKKEMKKELGECSQCGEPTEKEFCKTCEMIKKLKAEKKNKTKKKNVEKKYNKKLTCSTTKYKK
jgi:uncharacterized protein (TIGR00269 family)